MKKMPVIMFALLLISSSYVIAQVDHQDAVQNSQVNQEAVPAQEVAQPIENNDDKQEVNKDEGYGANDEEYYSAEGLNAENVQSENKESAL